ncbi:MAG: ComEA family DNA-binding protein [Nanobdellota archaeon]
MRKLILFSFLIILIINASCLCEDNQININEASLEELDKLSGIGPSKAQAIIDSRPFNSIDDLIEVSGIGEVTLENIKTQGIACVSKEEYNADKREIEEEEKEDEEKDKSNFEDDEIKEKQEIVKEVVEIKREKVENIQKELIVLTNLDRKDIKSEKNKENLDKNNYAVYGLIGFGILLLFLFIIKNYKRVRKNEFK